ncbi:MAG: hypothetical protein U5R31_03010 [Acidimicrobiia bacterium]|nr:hypothetical protein [Acidimicrobiia bacterium]
MARDEWHLDRDVALAWHTAHFTRATRGRKSQLKPLATYLRHRRPSPDLSPEATDALMDAARDWADQLNRKE